MKSSHHLHLKTLKSMHANLRHFAVLYKFETTQCSRTEIQSVYRIQGKRMRKINETVRSELDVTEKVNVWLRVQVVSV